MPKTSGLLGLNFTRDRPKANNINEQGNDINRILVLILNAEPA